MPEYIEGTHRLDKDGNPAGGQTLGLGVAIKWQDGPLGRGAQRKQPNGAFVEGVIEAAIDRLEFYQAGKFKCAQNAEALDYLRAALGVLHARTDDREQRAVEGTHAL